jgi:hypothetical protein
MKRLLLVILILILFSQGQAAGAMPEGIRPLGMGGAFLAVADDHHSIFYNPAGIIRVPGREISYIRNYESLRETYRLTLVSPDEGAGSFALAWEEKGENRLGILSYALKMGQVLSLGANYKYIKKPIVNADEDKGKGTGWDLGILFKFSKHFSIGWAIYDLGDTEIKENDLFQERFEQETRFGLAIRPLKNIILALDLKGEEESGENVLLGLEIGEGSSVFRVGVKGGELTTGLGYRTGNFQIDYAYQRVEEEDSEDLFSIALKF